VALGEAALDAMQEDLANEIAANARSLVPIGETGNLQQSIRVVSNAGGLGRAPAGGIEYDGSFYKGGQFLPSGAGHSWAVTAGDEEAPYASYVEYGTSVPTPAQPFMRPAADGVDSEAALSVGAKIMGTI